MNAFDTVCANASTPLHAWIMVCAKVSSALNASDAATNIAITEYFIRCISGSSQRCDLTCTQHHRFRPLLEQLRQPLHLFPDQREYTRAFLKDRLPLLFADRF